MGLLDPSRPERQVRYGPAFLAILTSQLQTKKHLNFFGGVLFLGDSPPKIPTFNGSDPERLERGPQYSARRRIFQKSQRTCSPAMGLQPQRKKTAAHSNTRGAPAKKPKKVPFLPVSAPFLAK